MKLPHASRTRRSLLAPLLVVLGLAPVATVAFDALADDDDSALSEGPMENAPEDTPWDAQKRVLARLPTDPSVLINVTGREMPASPDILNLGKRGTKALSRCLSDNIDAHIRWTCAVLLGRLGDRAALPALQGALDDWEAPVRNAAAAALAELPDATSVGPLLGLLARKDEDAWNRATVLRALGALGHPKAVAALRTELRAKPTTGPDLRATAFRALWASRHLMARETLVGDVAGALGSGEPGLVEAATEAAAELRSPRLVGALVPLLDHERPDVKNKAVYALGLVGDKTATKALLERLPKVRDARLLNNIAFALERLDRKAFYESIRAVIEHKQAIIRLNAAFVVGDVKRPEGVPLLAKALEDPSDYVKTSAIVALGKIGTEDATKLLAPFVDAPNLTMREGAVYAIVAQKGGKDLSLVHDKLFASKNWGVRQRAAVALGKAGDPRVREFLLGCFESQSCGVDDVAPYARADRDPAVSGRLLLSWTRGREELGDLLADLRPAGTLPLATSSVDASLAQGNTWSAKHAIDLVGDLGEVSAKGGLERHLADTDTWLRLHVAVALSRLGDPGADVALLREMDNLPADMLPAFTRLLQRIDEPSVQSRLLPELERRKKEADQDTALAAAAIHLAWNPEAGVFRLLEGLAAPSVRSRELAERYLRRNRADKVTWLLRRALAREERVDVRDRLRGILDDRPGA
jgi:HEAT repeat protein